MIIVVCLKQVPTRESILRIDPTNRWVQEADLSFDVNEPDVYALEEALRLKENFGGEVVICSLGPARVQQAIKEAFAKGADRAIHLEDPAFDGLDVLNITRIMAAALRNEKFDLLLTGLQSDDQGYGQTGVILSELLQIPHSTIVMEIRVSEDQQSVKVKRELEGGWFQWVQMRLPAVLTIQSGINQPRYATLRGIMGAKKKQINKLAAADLGIALPLRNRQVLQRVYVPTKAKRTEIIEGKPAEAALRLVDRLKNEAKVIS